MTPGPRIAVVAAAWGGTPTESGFVGLAPTIPQLFDEPCESIAVFNGPCDARDRADTLSLTRWAALSENAGVARGWNVGWQLSLADIVCFINEDIRGEPGSLRPLIEALDRNPEVGAVGPAGALWDMDRMTHRSFVEPTAGLSRCDAISGFALCVRRDALRAAGGFDERFSPAGGEEVDLCFSLRSAGWQLGVVACPAVKHEWGISARQPLASLEWIGGKERLVDIGGRSLALLRAKWTGVDFEAPHPAARVAATRWTRRDRLRARAEYARHNYWSPLARRLRLKR